MLDWHSCQICYFLEIKILSLLLLFRLKDAGFNSALAFNYLISKRNIDVYPLNNKLLKFNLKISLMRIT